MAMHIAYLSFKCISTILAFIDAIYNWYNTCWYILSRKIKLVYHVPPPPPQNISSLSGKPYQGHLIPSGITIATTFLITVRDNSLQKRGNYFGRGATTIRRGWVGSGATNEHRVLSGAPTPTQQPKTVTLVYIDWINYFFFPNIWPHLSRRIAVPQTISSPQEKGFEHMTYVRVYKVASE